MATTKLFGEHSTTAIIRWCAAQGMSSDEIKAALADAGVADVNKNTLTTQGYHGRRHAAGTPSGGALPDLSEQTAKALLAHKSDGGGKAAKKASRKKAPAKAKATGEKKATKKKTTKRKGA